MSSEIASVTWSRGASPEAMIDAFNEETLTVAVLKALLDDPTARDKALGALRGVGPG